MVATTVLLMARTDLGDMEHLVLLAILRLGADAYGIPILDEVCARSGRDVSLRIDSPTVTFCFCPWKGVLVVFAAATDWERFASII